MADCVKLPTTLCVLDTTRSPPSVSACAGSSSENARCAPHASSTSSGTPCACATSACPATSATAPKYVGETTIAATAPGVALSAWSRVAGVTVCAIRSSSSSSGAMNVGRSPDSTRPSIVEEWQLRCTTTSRPRWASAMQATWLHCDAPPVTNHVRCAPHASAASACACWKGVGSEPASMPWMRAGMSIARACSPIASTRPGSAPGPPLCPGTWKRPASRVAYAWSASRYGATLGSGVSGCGSPRGFACSPVGSSCGIAAEHMRGSGAAQGRDGPLRGFGAGVELHDAVVAQLPGVEAEDRLAGAAGEGDLRQRAPGPAYRDDRLARPGDESVAHLAETGRQCDVHEGVRVVTAQAGQQPHCLAARFLGSARGRLHHAA